LISSTGYWQGYCPHAYDAPLAKALAAFFRERKAKTIVDLGCGEGKYVSLLRKEGFACDGFDGNPDTPTLTDGGCEVLDLAMPFVFANSYEWILTLEVGEHIPAEYEANFLGNLEKSCTKGIVLSWAIKGQGGHGHFNEQDNDYVKAQFFERGFTNDEGAENFLRKKSSLRWFANTIMVFLK
jgi:2-polyprenyl-3-methyl-5-hydroxy-6-metoxy-1,4-benzoquinol methylase